MVDGLKGFPEAIGAVYPEAVVQTCIVHLLRYSLAHGSWKERRALAAALRPIYQAPTEAEAAAALDDFEAGPWGRKYPAIVRSWRSRWAEITPFLAFSAPIRRAIYTTNAIESLNSTVRRAVRTRGHFPNDRAAAKLIYLALRGVSRKWKNPPKYWQEAPRRVLHPVRRPVPDAAVVNPVRPGAGNAAARLASTRFAGPTLRFGPSGDPSRSAAYRLAMAVRGLTATAGRRGRRRPSSTTGFPANRVDFGTRKWGRQISTDDGYTMPCQSWRANSNRNSPTHGIPDSHFCLAKYKQQNQAEDALGLVNAAAAGTGRLLRLTTGVCWFPADVTRALIQGIQRECDSLFRWTMGLYYALLIVRWVFECRSSRNSAYDRR